MKRHISIFVLLLSAFAAVGDDVMRLTPVGYRLGETGDVTAYASSVVAVTPDGTSIVTSKKPVALTAVLNRDYKVVRWQKFDVDPTIRTGADPIEEFGEKSETVSVGLSTNVTWMYVAVVLEYDPVRSVKASLSSFARGTVSVSPEKTSYRKGDVVTLTAEPAEGYSFVRWSDGNADHVRRLTVDDDIDLTACIEPDSSRVSFSAGAGAVLDVTSKRVSYGSAYGELPVPERTGAKFSGWTDDEKRSVTEKTTVNRTADHTLYASWSDLLYEIAWKFTGRGNGKVDGAGTYAYGSQPTLKAVPYEGSAFTGWTDGVTLNPRRITVLSNALYVAAFDIATYDVTFTYRDAAGNLVTAGPTTVEHGGKVDPPSIPEWSEHTFANWSTEEYKKVTRDLAVEAIYDDETYSVAFAYRDWQGNSVTTMPQHVTAGGKANPPDRSVVDNWTGNTFKGWAPDYNVIKADTLCKAIYETNSYTVTFSYRGPDGEPREQAETVQHGRMVQSVPETAVVDSWPGHRFLGWSNDDYLRPITGKLEVFARYEGYCTIIYGDSLGTNYWDDVKDPRDWATLRSVEELGKMEGYAFKKTGYLFDYWSEEQREGTNTVVFTYEDQAKVPVKSGDVLTLKSNWKGITYKVRFDGNGGTCKLEPETLTYDQERVIEYNKKNEEQDVERANYKFLFWSRDPVETNEIYKTESIGLYDNVLTVSNLTTVADDTVVLYAVWKAESQTVTINGESRAFEYGSQLMKSMVQDPDPEVGLTFTGSWKTNNDVIVEFPIVVTGDFNLDPVWVTNKYEMSFDTAGGNAIAPVTNEYNAAIAAPADPTRKGHAFAGWYEGESAFVFGKMPARNVRLTAHWTANAYTVKFDPGEGSGKMADQPFTYDVAQALRQNSLLPPEGKVFDCWTNEVNPVTYSDRQTVSNLTSVSGGIFTLYATWTEAPSYVVAFHGASGTNATGAAAYTQTIECGKATALTQNQFARTGYGFAGWDETAPRSEGAAGTVVYTNGQIVTDLAAEGATNDLYAVWAANRYWVKFDDNGADGSKKMENQAFTYDVAQALTSNAFTRTGYGFAGWDVTAPATRISTSEAAAKRSLEWCASGTVVYTDGAVVSNLTAEANATNTLWATWAANHYTVKFNPNGGKGEVQSQGFTYDQSQKLMDNTFEPPEDLKSFSGWATNETGKAVYANGAEALNLTAEANGTVNLYAVWGDDSYTVTFNGNGKTGGAMAPQVFKHGETGTLTPNAFTRTGCGFAGWADGEDAVVTKYADGASFTAPATGIGETLYAVWTNNTYDCTFVERTEDNQRRKYGEKLDPLPGNPSKTGYMFGGWTTNGSDVVNLSAFTMPDHDVVFTQLWTPITYTIAFDGNGATEVAMAPTNVEYDVEIFLPSNTYEWAGHEFVKWTNSVGKTFNDGANVKNLSTTDGATVTLYAVWQETGNPLSIALGLDANFDVEVSPEGAWTTVGDAKYKNGLVRTSSNPAGTLRVTVPSGGTLHIELDVDSIGGPLSVKFEGEEIEPLNDDVQRDYGPESGGTFEFSGTPASGTTWTLKNFTWTPAQ